MKTSLLLAGCSAVNLKNQWLFQPMFEPMSFMRDMPHMGFNFGDMPQNGHSFSTSSSSSYSSEMGPDGKMHEHSNNQGAKEICENGVCRMMECHDGNCVEG